jgi:outer membrane translocation and assembly module TamA
MNPQKGLLTVASIKALIALSSSFYASYSVKCLVEQSFFWPIKAIVAALRIRFGHIFHHEFSTLMPTQRFYLGGSQSLRGYYADLAPPLGSYESYEQGVPKRVIVPRGAKSMININMELRIPLPRKIGVVLFQDLGTLADDVRAHFNTDKLLATTGFGLRYQTPLGPLRFDIGWKWFEDTFSHKSFGWYLAIGNAF